MKISAYSLKPPLFTFRKRKYGEKQQAVLSYKKLADRRGCVKPSFANNSFDVSKAKRVMDPSKPCLLNSVGLNFYYNTNKEKGFSTDSMILRVVIF